MIDRRALLRFLAFLGLVTLIVYYLAMTRPAPGGIRVDPGHGGPAAEPAATGPAAGQPAAAAPAAAGVPAAGSWFIDYRIERERAVSQQLERLRELLQIEGLDAATRAEAHRTWLEVSRDHRKALEVEALIRARGYEDAIVFLGNRFAQVIVRAAGLAQDDVVRIADLVARATGLGYDRITVSSRPD